jgi:hypothetical protein
MSTPVKRYSQAELDQLFRAHDFDKTLPLCTRQTICDEEFSAQNVPAKKFTKRKGYRYLDASTKDEVAVIFHYTLIDGNQRRAINRLVIGGKPHDATLP